MRCVRGHKALMTVDLLAERPVYQTLLVQRSRGLDRRQILSLICTIQYPCCIHSYCAARYVINFFLTLI